MPINSRESSMNPGDEEVEEEEATARQTITS